jgi:SAM-dependent methyltransferase
VKRRAILAGLPLLAGACANRGYGIGALLAGSGEDRAEREEAARDVPFVPTPDTMVAAMLDMAGVNASDTLIDLGSGYGRIALGAGRRGARALGVEIDPALVVRANARAAAEGLSDRVSFRTGDLFEQRLADATVVTLYLLPAINLRLRPRLLTELKAGTRVVSHAFDMGDWTPDAERIVDGRRTFLWVVPATAGGDWRVTLPDGRTARLSIEQRFQRISGSFDGRPLESATLAGDRLAFTVGGQLYAARVNDAAITADASVQGTIPGWRAVRAD